MGLLDLIGKIGIYKANFNFKYVGKNLVNNHYFNPYWHLPSETDH
jgi:hypothetical protein